MDKLAKDLGISRDELWDKLIAGEDVDKEKVNKLFKEELNYTPSN